MDQQLFNVFAAECPSRAAFEAIFSRWGMLTLGALCVGSEPLRFGALRRAVAGISEKMLSQTLKELEEEGLVHKAVWEAQPPRVEYSLTPAGAKIARGIGQVITDLYTVLEERVSVPSA